MGTTALTVPALLGGHPLFAQEAAVTEAFSFDLLTEAARSRAAEMAPGSEELAPVFKDLTYDDYQMIQFRPSRVRWKAKDSTWNLLPFHLGWLFKEPVRLHEVVDGMATELTFTTDDFEYRGHLKQDVPAGTALPGVAGFKLTHPLNRSDKMDEIISFVGASYFRALGLGNTYGLSARGLAIDSGLTKAEEFPRFSGFWLERPAPSATAVTIYAALDSASATGAYRFVVTPGVETVVEVTARLFFRSDVEQLGVAPLTSMFLFADVNRAGFDDYRPRACPFSMYSRTTSMRSPTLTVSSPCPSLNCSSGMMPSDLRPASTMTKSFSMRITSPTMRPPGAILLVFRLCSNSSAKDSLMIVHWPIY